MTAGTSFPQDAPLTVEEAAVFFASQTRTACAFDKAEDREQLIGFYLLHPNNVGRCSHIANASYGVTAAARGRGCGHQLVEDSLYWAKRTGSGCRTEIWRTLISV